MAPKPSAPSNRSGGSKNPPPKKNVVIASITSTNSANHATTTTTTSFNRTGSTSSSSSTSSSNRPPVVRPAPPPPPSSDRSPSAGGSSSSSSSAAAPRPKPPVVVGGSGGASAPSAGGGGASSSSSAAAAGPVKPVVVHVGKGGKNAIIVNARQRGNPIMNHIKNVAWEYGDIVPDYVVGQHTCILYLSLRYHRLHPEYLHQRIEKLGVMYQLRVLLVMCDVSDHQDPIREISKVCIINNLTVMVCWTPEEAGIYLATYKIYEHKPPDILKEKVHNDYRSYLNRSLTGIKGVNKTDVLTLSSSFGTFDRIIHASPEELSVCPGVGETKVRRLVEAFTGKFKGSSSSSSSSRPSAAAVPSTQGGVAKVIAVATGDAEDVDDEEVVEVSSGGNSKKGKGKGRLLDGKGNAVVVEEEVEEGASSNARKGAQKEYSPDWPDEEEETPLPPMSPEWEDEDEEEGGEARPRAEGKKIATFSDDDDEEEEEEEKDAKKKRGRELTADSP